MSDPNEAVFELARKVVFTKTVDRAEEQTADRARGISKFVKMYNNRVYLSMAQNGIFAADSTPSILTQGNPFGKVWPAHKINPKGQSYIDKKASQGFDTPGFYRRTGKLARSMFGRSGNADFGSADVTVGVAGQGINTSKYSVDSEGRPRYSKGSRNSAGTAIGGRFAGLSAFRSLLFTIETQLFTKLKGNLTQGDMEALYGDEPFGVKLLVGEFGRTSGKGRSQPARPLVRPFLHWYATTNFRQELSVYFGKRV